MKDITRLDGLAKKVLEKVPLLNESIRRLLEQLMRFLLRAEPSRRFSFARLQGGRDSLLATFRISHFTGSVLLDREDRAQKVELLVIVHLLLLGEDRITLLQAQGRFRLFDRLEERLHLIFYLGYIT